MACRRQWDMHISRKVDAAEAARHPLARLYRGYYRIATDTYADLSEAYQMWVDILTEDVMVAREAVAAGTRQAVHRAQATLRALHRRDPGVVQDKGRAIAADTQRGQGGCQNTCLDY